MFFRRITEALLEIAEALRDIAAALRETREDRPKTKNRTMHS
jgi:hypothetical protein